MLPKHALAHLCRAVLKTAENPPPRRNVNLCVVCGVYDEYISTIVCTPRPSSDDRYHYRPVRARIPA